ncbi:hypothetical protein RR46_06168 [Papilio xuthus]|uniref:Uncharacterized protein n=1 Tax=Papilio xuthus TaxID=66420 RepID=A0A194QDG5_PAPXU|nr:hypothetical protein RR46_06168 [Papilio xuthus]
MLLLLLLLHNVIAHDFQTDATYSVNVTDKCPDDGYYYKEDMSSNEVDGVCRLCFCKNNTAVCWLRPKSQCHTKMYIRMDKSALCLVFSKKTSHSCKPLGTTLSDDCPPDDWCLGCTVCDCERSGLWNCHILSFCSDRKLKKHYQNNNNTIKRTPVEIHSNLDNQNKINSTKMHRLARKMNVNHNNVKSWRQDFSTTYQYPYSAKHDDNVVVFQKDLVERKSKDIQGVRIKKIINENNVNARLNHKVVQRAMAAVQKIINKTERNFTNSTKHKVIHKRSMPQHDTKNNYQHQTTYVSPHMYKKSSPKRFRKKLSLNKITKEELRKKRIRRNTVNQAKKLSSATTNRRKRSAVGDDDAIEYLLTIMEYLLKQNYPLDATPVNDGIDLLIDAIKHAPDIKPIKKKVLDASTTRTYPWPTEKATAETFSYVDNIYGLDSLDKDNNDTSGSDDNQITFSKSTDDGNDKVEDFQKLLHASKKISNSFRLSNFNNILKNAKLKSMSSTSATIVTTTPMIQYDFLKDNIAESDTETSVKIGPGIANDDRNDVDSFKSFNNENKPDNEEFPPNLIKLNGDSDVEIQVTLPTRTKATPRTTRKFHHMVRDKFDNPKIITYVGKPTKKSKFGWVDYDLGDDGSKKTERKIFSKSTERSTAPGGASKNRALSTADKNDVSAISKEIMDEEKRKQFYKLLPNSEVRKFTSRNMLDVTIKSEVDSDSKDTEGEDTYVNDVFPSYLT